MTRAEHLAWCKQRANEYLERGRVQDAVTSMLSDLSKHPDTDCKNPFLVQLGMLAAMNGDQTEARRFIDGFN